jgi:hypothetical protein
MRKATYKILTSAYPLNILNRSSLKAHPVPIITNPSKVIN